VGLEAECTLEWQGRSIRGKALLETTELLFRGPTRLKIARDRVTAVTAEGVALRVTFGGETATFALGAAAEKWARALATVKSRLDKLGVTPGLSIGVVGVDDASFLDELRGRIGAFVEGEPGEGRDLVFFGVRARADLDRLAALAGALSPRGGLWVIRPKGRAEITEAEVRAAARAAGLVDVKVASFSPTHTADKFVIPAAARGAGAKPERVPATRARRG
jgi:hypothetical protein